MDWLLAIFLRRYIRQGTLTVTSAAGRTYTFGDGSGPPVAVRFTTAKAQREVLFNPQLRLGEAYMDGTFVLDRGSIADVLAILLRQDHIASPRWAVPLQFVRYLLRRVQQFNPRSRSRRNVAHHYDLDGRLYTLFLDADQQYSCAYFETPDQSLDDAQLAKKRHLAAKLLLEPGSDVLDIGCGWGGLALYLAEIGGAQVTGITLSQEQLRARDRARRERGRRTRAISGCRTIATSTDHSTASSRSACSSMSASATTTPSSASAHELLDDDGVMLLHSIGRSEGPSITNAWIAKYIFPGGYIPALSEVLPAIERSRLAGHRHRDPAAALRRDAQGLARALPRSPRRGRTALRRALLRMWEFYLASSEMAFREQRHDGVPDPDGQTSGRGAA